MTPLRSYSSSRNYRPFRNCFDRCRVPKVESPNGIDRNWYGKVSFAMFAWELLKEYRSRAGSHLLQIGRVTPQRIDCRLLSSGSAGARDSYNAATKHFSRARDVAHRMPIEIASWHTHSPKP